MTNIDQGEGPGIVIAPNGCKNIGEYHLDKCHGCLKDEYANCDKYWGEYKDNKREGYGTYEWVNGGRYIGQWL